MLVRRAIGAATPAAIGPASGHTRLRVAREAGMSGSTHVQTKQTSRAERCGSPMVQRTRTVLLRADADRESENSCQPKTRGISQQAVRLLSPKPRVEHVSPRLPGGTPATKLATTQDDKSACRMPPRDDPTRGHTAAVHRSYRLPGTRHQRRAPLRVMSFDRQSRDRRRSSQPARRQPKVDYPITETRL